MAVRVDASGDKLTRTTNLPGGIRGVTMCGWFKMAVDTNNYACVMNISTGTSYYTYIETYSDGTDWLIWDQKGAGNSMFIDSVGTWNFMAMTIASDGTEKAYWAPIGTQTLSTITRSTYTQDITVPDLIAFGDSCWGGEYFNGSMSALKVWTAELTQAELELEMQSIRPQRFANLWGWFPTQPGTGTRGKDFSGNGYNLTEGGTLTDEDDPPIRYGARVLVPGYAVAVTPTFIQEGHRWRNDNGDEDAATWLADQDADGALTINTPIRLRAIIDTTGDTASSQYRLEVRPKNSSVDWEVVVP